jgi:hypothetical protein
METAAAATAILVPPKSPCFAAGTVYLVELQAMQHCFQSKQGFEPAKPALNQLQSDLKPSRCTNQHLIAPGATRSTLIVQESW